MEQCGGAASCGVFSSVGLCCGSGCQSGEILKQECLLQKKKLGLSATARVVDGSWRGDFLSSPEAWK